MLVAEYENQAHDLVFVFLQVHYISVYISTETLATDYYKKERIIIIIIIIAPKLHFPNKSLFGSPLRVLQGTNSPFISYKSLFSLK
jgi:hypothetical protein